MNGLRSRPVSSRSRTRQKESVPSTVRAAVLSRDRGCFLRRIDRDHQCRDQWGYPHRSDDLARLTMDHVHRHSGGTLGKRAEHDPSNLVAMCWAGNVGVPSKEVRQAQREYLTTLEAAAEHAHVEPVHGCDECWAALHRSEVPL